MFNSVFFSSNSNEWSTPDDFFKALDSEFHFNLDPCASLLNHKCDNYFTIDDDGLSKSWSGFRVFCNPPYGHQIKYWVQKCYIESVLNSNTLIVLLIPARTDTSYFHDYILGKCDIRFIRGRLKFGGSSHCAPFGSILCIYNG